VSGQAPPTALWTSIHTSPEQLHTLAQDLRSRHQHQHQQQQQQQPGASASAAQGGTSSPRAQAAASPPGTPAVQQQQQQQQQQRHRLTSSGSSSGSPSGTAGGTISAGGPATAAAPGPAAPAASGSYQIKVMSPSGELRLQAQPHMLVEWLKAVICSRTEVPANQQRLICSGRQLEDGLTLEQYGLGQGSVVHVVVQLRGY
jgi:hypothetical protein